MFCRRKFTLAKFRQCSKIVFEISLKWVKNCPKWNVQNKTSEILMSRIFLQVMRNRSIEEFIKQLFHSCSIRRDYNNRLLYITWYPTWGPNNCQLFIRWAIITRWNSTDEIFPDIFMLLETTCFISLFSKSDMNFCPLLFIVSTFLTGHLQVFEENHINLLKRKITDFKFRQNFIRLWQVICHAIEFLTRLQGFNIKMKGKA